MKKNRSFIWGAGVVVAAGSLWFSMNQAKPALPQPDVAVVAAQKRAIETIAHKRLASATLLCQTAEKSELQGDLGRALILYRQALAGYLAVPGNFPGSRAALSLQNSKSADARRCATARRKVGELTEVAGANPLWQFLWQASLRGSLPSSFIIDSLHDSQAAVAANGAATVNAGQLLALVKDGHPAEAVKSAGNLGASAETVAALRQMAEIAVSGGDPATAVRFLHLSWNASRTIGIDAGIGNLLAAWSDRFDPETALQVVGGNADPAASGVLLTEMVAALRAKGRMAQAEKLLDAAWSQVDANGRIAAALALGRYRKALEVSRDATDRARIVVAATQADALADLLPTLHRYYAAVQPESATRELGVVARGLLAAGQRPAALKLAGDVGAERNSEAVKRIIADLLKSPDDEMLLGLGALPGIAACRSWHEAMLVRFQEVPSLLAKLTDLRGRTPPGALRDQLAILAMEQALTHDDLDQARNLLAEVSCNPEKRLALERMAAMLADRGAFLTVRQIIRDQDPATTDGMWIALACGYARTSTMADALKMVDEQVASKENRQRGIVAIARRLMEAGRHPAAILTLNKLDDRGQQLALIYEFAAQLSQDRDSTDYAALKEMIKKYPVEEQVGALIRKWAGLRQELADNPARIDDPEIQAWLRFCKKAYALAPAAWLLNPPGMVAEIYPFANAEQAFDHLSKPLDALEIRRLAWKHGDAATRQALLGRMFGCDSFQEIMDQIGNLPDTAEADRFFHRFSVMLTGAKRYEEALALVAMVSKRGDAIDAAGRQAWLDEVKAIAVAMSRQRVPFSSRMEETVAQIGIFLPPDPGQAPGKPSTPD